MKLIIGSHVGVSGKEMLLGAVKQTIEFGANTFMFYTGAPQNTVRKPIEEFNYEEAHKLMLEYNISKDNVIVHAPYIINMANTTKPRVIELAHEFLQKELERVEELGFKYLVIHPGSHLGVGIEEGVKQIANVVNSVLEVANSKVILLFETMAGKGTEVGFELEHLFKLIELTKTKDRVGICLDTCHLHDAGYDISKFDNILDKIENNVGLDYVKAVHVNDSKNIQGAKKDRHENIGFGEIGFDALLEVIYNPRISNIPKILETPWVNDKPPYKEEITMIKAKSFNANFKKELEEL